MLRKICLQRRHDPGPPEFIAARVGTFRQLGPQFGMKKIFSVPEFWAFQSGAVILPAFR
jgi:hypothetical protein